MKRQECVHCGETVVVADDGETVTGGETPVAHLQRTGHAHIREPRPTGCPHCGYLWMYSGEADMATCPNCRGKAVPGEIPDTE